MRRFWLGCVLVSMTIAVYVNSFPAAFHFDDFALLLDNPQVTQPDFRYGSLLEQYAGRPLTLWLFHEEHRFFGANPQGYHAVSLLLHSLVVVALFLCLLQWFSDEFLAFSTALIFSLHPLQTQAVNYIWAGSVLLMAGFGLTSLLVVRRYPRLAWILLQLSIWSRTEGVLFALPLILLRRDRWKWPAFLAGLNTALFVRSVYIYHPRDVAWTHPEALRYWLDQLVAFWGYVRFMVWPVGLSIDHDFGSPGIVLILASALGLLGLLAFGLWIRGRRPILALGLFGGALFFLPTSLIPNSDVFNETRAYLPLAGAALLFGWFLSRQRRVVRVSVLLLAVGAMLPVTLYRNQVWKDDVLLWMDAVAKSPEKGRAHYNLGVAIVKRGDLERAKAEFETAARLNPLDDLSYAALGYCAELQGELPEAKALYGKAVELNQRNRYARDGWERVDRVEEETGT